MKTQQIPPIPWQQPRELEEAALFFHTIDQVHGRSMAPVWSLAREIRNRLDALSHCIDELCRLTCPVCTDICCRRATIWYDFKDLACLYFAGDGFPGQQIERVRGILSIIKISELWTIN